MSDLHNEDSWVEVECLTFQYRWVLPPTALKDLFIRRGSAPCLKRPALQGVDFRLKKGEVIGLIGPNGSGKSTLCALLSGALRPCTGHVRTPRNVRNVQRGSFTMEMDFTGRENAAMGAALFYPERPLAESMERIEYYSALGEKLDEPLRAYSRGMVSRLSYAISLCWPAELLLLDEPPGGPDRFSRRYAEKNLEQVLEQSGGGVLVSHSEAMLRRYTSRLLVLNAGKLVYDGPIDAGIEAYHSLELL